MENLREEVISNLRACLISTKGMSDLRTVKRDYHMLMGEQIPYVKLGFKTLEDFIHSIKTLRTHRGSNGELFVDAMASKQSVHISSMINKQKEKKKRAPSRQIRNINFTHHNTPPSKWRPKNFNNRARPNYSGVPRPTVASHNQFVNHPKSPRKVNAPPRYVQKPQPASVVNNNSSEANIVPTQTRSTRTVEKCTALVNTKMRIVKKMTDMSIESDSSSSDADRVPPSDLRVTLKENAVENLRKEALAAVDPASSLWNHWSSSDESGNAGKQKEPFKLTGNTLVDLENFVVAHQLPEIIFKVIQRKTKRNITYYDCQIKIGKHSFSSYPSDFTNLQLSKEYVGKLALGELISKYGRKRSLLLSQEKDILERIPPIVQKHSNGVWNSQLEADYVDMYQEQLPSNWLEIVDISPNISVESLLENRYILRYCKPGEKGNRSFSPLASEISVPSNTVQFLDDGYLTAIVTCVVSAGELWCRQVGTPESDEFERMSVRMEDFYNNRASSSTLNATEISVGGYYVVKTENLWHRVRILEVTSSEVICFCIDYGDEYVLPKDSVYQMRREFAIEQAQAFVCRLEGLEELYETSRNSEHLQNLVGRAVQLELVTETPKSDPTDPILCVVLYDTEDQVFVNEKLIPLIIMESATPTLKENAATEVFVSNMEPNGDIYVQVESQGYEQLMSALKTLEKVISEAPPALKSHVTPTNSENRLYFAKYKEDNQWYRVKIIDWAPNGKYAQLYYVDYGNTDIINVENEVMFPMDDLSEVAAQYPHQAVKVRMALESVPSDFVQKMKALVPVDLAVLLKVMRYDSENVPVVELFKRSETDNVLFSINNSIEVETEFGKPSPGDSNNNGLKSTKLQRLISLNQFEDKNVPSGGCLSAPVLPEIGQYFDIKIACAVNPWNFFVQPYKHHLDLQKLMQNLQEKYKDVQFSPLQIDGVEPGNIYASKHEDGMWYRTIVIKVIHAGSISVFYCDFGYYANLTIQQLIPLDPAFTVLPYQALKAKLAGIKPKQTKWTMDDCTFFQNLVVKKPFVSVLVSTEKDELYRCDTVLNLIIIDTSTEEDVYIDKILIQKGIAVAC